MADKSPTQGGDDASGGPNGPLPEEQHQQPSADEQHQGTVSSDDESQDAGQVQDRQEEQDTSQEPNREEDDEGLNKFAKAQGFDPENLTDGERKALKLAHDNQRAFRQTNEENEEFRRTVEDVNQPDEDVDNEDPYARAIEQVDARSRIAEAKMRVMQFEQENPDAKEYKSEMSKVLQQTKEEHGVEAARYLARDLDTLLLKAKNVVGDDTPDKAREAGRREERESLRKKQEAGAGPSAASQPQTGGTKLTPDAIREMDDEEYAKIRASGELDEAMKQWQIS